MTDWTSEQIPSQAGRVVIVTGSSSGLGQETARVLARKGAEVILAVRNVNKGAAVAKLIQDEFPSAQLHVHKLDLASLTSVTEFTEAFQKEYQRLDLLINNAGVMIPPYSKTEDGFELQFGTNHLGHFALTIQLLELLKATSASRIVNVSSMAHRYGELKFSDLNWESRKYNAGRAYGDSKIANLYFTYALAKRLRQTPGAPLVLAAHPGWTSTELQRHMSFSGVLNGLFAQNLAMGTLPTLRAAIDPEARSGDYYGPKGFMEMRGYPVKVSSNALSHDQAIAEKLWTVSEMLTAVRYPATQKGNAKSLESEAETSV